MRDIQEIGVRVTYKDKDMRPIYTKTYPICEYTDMLRQDLHRLITDVENLCYVANENKSKADWSDETFEEFSRIKHKLLDKAGEIGRLPQNIVLRTKEPLNEYMARILEEGTDAYGESRVGS